MPWVSDGVSNWESTTLALIASLADKHIIVAEQIASLPWVLDGVAHSEENVALAYLDGIAERGAGLAGVVANRPWVADGIFGVELDILGQFADLASQDVSTAATVIGLPWLDKGIQSDYERALFLSLLQLARVDPGLATNMALLEWVRDHVFDYEAETLAAVVSLAEQDVALASRIISNPGLTGGSSRGWVDALNELRMLAEVNPGEAMMLSSLQWFGEWSWTESDSLRHLRTIGQKDANLLHQVTALQWLMDDITENERSALSSLAGFPEGAASQLAYVLTLPWLQDNVDQNEARALKYLSEIASKAMPLTGQLLALDWLQDSITEQEKEALGSIQTMAGRSTVLDGLLSTILASSGPGEDTVDTLGALAAGVKAVGHELLAGQTWLLDGISQEEILFLQALPLVARASPDSLDSLLASRHLESRKTTLPLAGQVELVVLRTSPPAGTSYRVDDLEAVVRATEGFMDIPFPSDNVFLLFAKTVASRETQGEFFGGYGIVVLLGSDRPGDTTVAHEVGHYYWDGVGEPSWLTEGGASFIASYVHQKLFGVSLESRKPALSRGAATCRSNGIASITQLLEQGHNWQCNYDLGEYLFIFLFETMGEQAFIDAWKEIYLAKRDSSRQVSEDAIYRSFLEHTPSSKIAEFKQTWDKWYGGDFTSRW